MRPLGNAMDVKSDIGLGKNMANPITKSQYKFMNAIIQ